MKKTGVFGTLDPFLEGGPILGRRVANVGFLRALLARDPFDAYHFFLADKPLRDSLSIALAEFAPELSASGRLVIMDRRELPARLRATDYACFHQSDCINHPTHIARLRNALSPALFPVTGPMLHLYWATSGFGERAVRAGVWLLALLLLPFIANSPVGHAIWSIWYYLPDFPAVAGFFKSLSESISASAAMEYIPFTKDIKGEGWAKVGQALWQSAVMLQFTLFALAVRNRFRR